MNRDNFECSKQDRTSLSTTSSTPRSRPRTSAGRAQVRPAHDPGAIPDLGSRRKDMGKTAGVMVLAVLMGLTSWVVASVSTWLVPVYVTAMVLIFVVPRAHHPEDRERAGTEPEDRTDHAHRALGPSSAGSSPEGPVSLEMHGSSEVSASESEPARFRGKAPARPGPRTETCKIRHRASRCSCCYLDSGRPGQVCPG